MAVREVQVPALSCPMMNNFLASSNYEYRHRIWVNKNKETVSCPKVYRNQRLLGSYACDLNCPIGYDLCSTDGLDNRYFKTNNDLFDCITEQNSEGSYSRLKWRQRYQCCLALPTQYNILALQYARFHNTQAVGTHAAANSIDGDYDKVLEKMAEAQSGAGQLIVDITEAVNNNKMINIQGVRVYIHYDADTKYCIRS